MERQRRNQKVTRKGSDRCDGRLRGAGTGGGA